MQLNGKIWLLIGTASLLAFAVFQLKDFHVGIGERAMGGYDGYSTSEAAANAKRRAREAAARAEAAVDSLGRMD